MKAPARVEVSSRAAWRAWLLRHHMQAESIWLVTWRKAAGEKHLPYDAIVEEALCFGWIDSLGRRLDEERTMLLVSPRKAGSGWSGVNRARIERLLAAGRMHPAGLARIEAARADGSWARLDAATTLDLPADLVAAFGRHEGAAERFQAFPPSARRAILEWIANAKRPATRERRVDETARLAAQNVRANASGRRSASGG